MSSIKQKMREGYDQQEYKKIRRAERAIKTRHQQCLKNQRLSDTPTTPRKGSRNSQVHLRQHEFYRQHHQPYVNMKKQGSTDTQYTASNQIYGKRKAKAWDEYFQLEPRCRQQKQSRSDFVYCAQSKKQQRRQFELMWQNIHNK
ncbi:hypothetical protein [Catenovulum agarivorans]|nr:hypothetical protein [Catenovulum agarivorans]